MLWARVEPSVELLRLHGAVAAALTGEGFEPEGRPYTPHVSVVRWQMGALPGASVTASEAGPLPGEFLTLHAGFRLAAVQLLPGLRFHEVIGFQQETIQHTFIIPPEKRLPLRSSRV